MRKKACLLLAVALLTVLVGLFFVRKQKPADEPALIGYIYLSEDSVFNNFVKADFQQLAENNPQIQVDYVNGQKDAQVQNRAIHDFVERGAKAIILNNASATEVRSGILEANRAGIPVITTERAFGAKSVYVGSSDYEIGWRQGKYMCEHMPLNGRLVIIYGPLDRDVSQKRLWGFIDACLVRRTDIQLIASGDGKYLRSEAAGLMRSWLQQYPDIDGLAVSSDEMAIGALQALTEAGRPPVVVSSVDGTPEAVELIREGWMGHTVQQDPRVKADGIYDCLLQILRGNEHVDDRILPVLDITKANADSL